MSTPSENPSYAPLRIRETTAWSEPKTINHLDEIKLHIRSMSYGDLIEMVGSQTSSSNHISSSMLRNILAKRTWEWANSS